MKFLLIPIFLFSFDQINTLNYNLIKLNQQNSVVLKEYTLCLQKNKNTRKCFLEKKIKQNKIKQQKQQIYSLLKKTRLQNQKKALLEYSKHKGK